MTKLVPQLERMMTAIAIGKSPADVIREGEKAAGRRVLRPGDEPWFRAEDWDADAVLSIDGDTVRIVLILAREPQRGAFRKLCQDIASVGLRPCVVAPTIEMQNTLTRWGWKHRIHGFGFESEDWWTPRRGGPVCG